MKHYLCYLLQRITKGTAKKISAFDKIIQAITETIKMNDRIVSMSEKIKALSYEVRNIDSRLIRLETMVEIAEKQRYLKTRKDEIVN